MTAVEWLSEQLDNELELYNSEWLKIEKIIEQAKEMEKEQIIRHSVELTKLLFSNPFEKSGKTPQQLVDNYFKNK